MHIEFKLHDEVCDMIKRSIPKSMSISLLAKYLLLDYTSRFEVIEKKAKETERRRLDLILRQKSIANIGKRFNKILAMNEAKKKL